MNVFDVFQEVAECSSKTGKIDILKRNDSQSLRTALYLTYNKFITYRVNQIDLPETFSELQPDVIPMLEQVLLKLAEHNTKPAKARAMLDKVVRSCTEENANWVSRIIKRDLKIGISEGTINKAFPKLLPTFNVQLAHPMVDKKSGKTRWDTVEYPVVVEEKFDGMRVVIVCHGDRVDYFSREGLPLDLKYLDDQVLGIRAGTKFVLDGEGIGVVYNPKCAVAKKAFDKGMPWQFAQGLSMIKSKSKYTDSEMHQFIGFKIWDVIDYDFFMSQGKKGKVQPLRARKLVLLSLFERADFVPRDLIKVENRLAFSKQEVIDYFNEVRAAGGEGVVVKDPQKPYEFKRSNAVLKVKQFYTADLRVVDVLEGTPDTKHAGSLGTLLVSDGEITGKVMGGFSDEQRDELWLKHLRGELVDTIVEVDYMDITAGNSLRHASFLRERPDKTECSWN